MLTYNPKHRLTSEQCLNHPYFHLVAPNLQANVELPRIPFSVGQPKREELDVIFQELEEQRRLRIQDLPQASNIAPRAVPPSHSNSPALEKSAFMDPGRMLPPPVVSPFNRGSFHSNEPSGRFDPGSGQQSATNSQTMLPVLPHDNGASALVDALRELDLPTADLASYGHQTMSPGRGPSWQRPAAVPHQPDRRGSDLIGLRSSSHLGDAATSSQSSLARSARRDSYSPGISQQAPNYQRNFLPPHMSTPTSLATDQQAPVTPSSFDALPQPPAHDSSDSLPAQHRDMDVDMQDVSEKHASPTRRTSVPNHSNSSQLRYSHSPPPAQPAQHQSLSALTQSRMSDVAATGKKKKWGLSSVFGSRKDAKSDYRPPPAGNIASSAFSSSTLKRTDVPDEAMLPMASTPAVVDPKRAKKEQEKLIKEQQKQLQLAKRKALEEAQKERARAVLAKRNQIAGQGRPEAPKPEPSKFSSISECPEGQRRSTNTSHSTLPGGVKSYSTQDVSRKDPYFSATYTQASRSQPTSVGSISSSTPMLTQRQRELIGPDASRFKSRKMGLGDDHSGFRSSLTVGTVDSE